MRAKDSPSSYSAVSNMNQVFIYSVFILRRFIRWSDGINREIERVKDTGGHVMSRLSQHTAAGDGEILGKLKIDTKNDSLHNA